MKNGVSELGKAMIGELSRGEECAKQLQSSLHSLTPASGTQSLLVKEVVSSFANVLSLLRDPTNYLQRAPLSPAVTAVDSPRSLTGSPVSDADDSGKSLRELERRDICRKRKALPKWTQQVRISSEYGPDGSFDDGYNWRKYGQKDILGAKYPRGYYRCTHRYLQGCQATKQVQRSDDDPSVFGITYRGEHTCSQATDLIPPGGNLPEKQQRLAQPQDHQPNLLMSYQCGLKVQTQGLDEPAAPAPSSFSFSSPLEQHQLVNYQQPFDQLAGVVSPAFVLPASSENCYTISPRHGGMEVPTRRNTSECDLADIISAATSTTNSPIIGMEFPMDPFDLDHHDLSFHLPGFFYGNTTQGLIFAP